MERALAGHRFKPWPIPVEPTDVGPAVGGDQSASEADHVHVVTLLKAAQTEGRLSVDDRDRRIQQAMSASTFDDLVPLTRDLVSPTGNAAAAVINYDEASATEEADQVVAILGGSSRRTPGGCGNTPRC